MKLIEEFKTSVMERLTTRCSDRFAIIAMEPSKYSWQIVIGNEIIKVNLAFDKIVLRYKDHCHHTISGILMNDIEQLRQVISLRCMQLIELYRRRNNIKVVNDKLVSENE